MTDIQSEILAALDAFEWRTLTQLSERTKLFRRRIEYEIKQLVAAGAVTGQIVNTSRPLGLYRLSEPV